MASQDPAFLEGTPGASPPDPAQGRRLADRILSTAIKPRPRSLLVQDQWRGDCLTGRPGCGVLGSLSTFEVSKLLGVILVVTGGTQM